MIHYASEIAEAVYSRFYDFKTTLFLCGAGSDKNDSIREVYDRLFSEGHNSYRYEIFYPEDLFDELLVGPGHHDLISLEDMLASSVDAVLLIVESYGATAELGSFASNTRLRNKLIVLVDKKFEKSKSFINYGPLRLIKDSKQGKVEFIEFENPKAHFARVRRLVSSTKRNTKKTKRVNNVIQAHLFVRSCIYLLGTISRQDLAQLVEVAAKTNKRTASALTSGALSILSNRAEIDVGPDGFRLTKRGTERFMGIVYDRHTRMTYDLEDMDSIRLKILTESLRG